jgi:hypothetical protein
MMLQVTATGGVLEAAKQLRALAPEWDLAWLQKGLDAELAPALVREVATEKK